MSPFHDGQQGIVCTLEPPYRVSERGLELLEKKRWLVS